MKRCIVVLDNVSCSAEVAAFSNYGIDFLAPATVFNNSFVVRSTVQEHAAGIVSEKDGAVLSS